MENATEFLHWSTRFPPTVMAIVSLGYCETHRPLAEQVPLGYWKKNPSTAKRVTSRPKTLRTRLLHIEIKDVVSSFMQNEDAMESLKLSSTFTFGCSVLLLARYEDLVLSSRRLVEQMRDWCKPAQERIPDANWEETLSIEAAPAPKRTRDAGDRMESAEDGTCESVDAGMGLPPYNMNESDFCSPVGGTTNPTQQLTGNDFGDDFFMEQSDMLAENTAVEGLGLAPGSPSLILQRPSAAMTLRLGDNDTLLTLDPGTATPRRSPLIRLSVDANVPVQAIPLEGTTPIDVGPLEDRSLAITPSPRNEVGALDTELPASARSARIVLSPDVQEEDQQPSRPRTRQRKRRLLIDSTTLISKTDIRKRVNLMNAAAQLAKTQPRHIAPGRLSASELFEQHGPHSLFRISLHPYRPNAMVSCIADAYNELLSDVPYQLRGESRFLRSPSSAPSIGGDQRDNLGDANASSFIRGTTPMEMDSTANEMESTHFEYCRGADRTMETNFDAPVVSELLLDSIDVASLEMRLDDTNPVGEFHISRSPSIGAERARLSEGPEEAERRREEPERRSSIYNRPDGDRAYTPLRDDEVIPLAGLSRQGSEQPRSERSGSFTSITSSQAAFERIKSRVERTDRTLLDLCANKPVQEVEFAELCPPGQVSCETAANTFLDLLYVAASRKWKLAQETCDFNSPILISRPV